MASHNYSMNTAWVQSNLQLENEYDMDPTLFDIVQPDPSVPSQTQDPQRFQRRQDQAFPTYPQSYAGATPQQHPSFTFEHSRTLNHSLDNSNSYFNPALGGSSQVQRQRPVQVPSNHTQYNSPPTVQQQPMYADNYAYPQQPQQLVRSPPSTTDPGTSPSFDPSLPPPNVYVSAAPFRPTYPPADHGSQAPVYFRQDANGDLLSAQPLKRMRGSEDAPPYQEGDADQDDSRSTEVKQRPAGACARCKGLKVKCEFKTDPDTCKRCLNGGHECIIPGRKKRRAPPKREHLLSQIRDQAAQIKALMGQLEEANRKMNATQSHISNAPSPSLSSSNTDLFSSVSIPASSSSDADGESLETPGSEFNKPDVMDWITKARESLEVFGGYLNMGGPSATTDQLIEGDGGSTGSTEQYEFDVEGPDDSVLSQTEMGHHSDYDDHSGEDDETKPRRGSHAHRLSGTNRLATIPSPAAPFGLMADFSLKMGRRRRPSSRDGSDVGDDEEDVGLASNDYFRPNNVERPIHDPNDQTPHILKSGVVNPQEVEDLFKIYWDYMNLSVSLLDPHLYTPQATFWRSPFLFTVICAISSRYYMARPDLYQAAMRYARLAAGTALISGRKTVEAVQAYILLALYPMPCHRWEDDRTWVYLGLAIRIAADLNLHHPNTATPKNEQHAREMLNRTRVWLNCFNLDRSTGSQYGKPPIIPNTDYVANQSGTWWNASQYNLNNFDIQIAAYTADLRLVANFAIRVRGDGSNPYGIDKSLDIAAIASETDDKLKNLWESWSPHLKEHEDPKDLQGRFRTALLRLAYSYARLSALSFGFQYQFGRKAPTTTRTNDEQFLLLRCFRAATDVLKAYLEEIALPEQMIFLRHGPEAQSVFVTFAAAFLIKLLHPRFSKYLNKPERTEARSLVQRLSDVMAEVAVDDRHSPKLYSQFLKSLLASPMADVDQTEPLIKREPTARKVMVKAKSASPATKQAELYDGIYSGHNNISTPSSTRQSHSPPPSRPMDGVVQYESFTTVGEPFPDAALLANDMTSEINNQFYQPPLGFGAEFIQSMQNMQTLSEGPSWSNMVIPGFAWMGDFNQDTQMSGMGSV
ncbi:hypothetical protein C8Q75DRAFT_736365 [Abortiporus biennis]|nr:hypothetical protein C8Q75DRAFT_736365 [Abortiporus biennis]